MTEIIREIEAMNKEKRETGQKKRTASRTLKKKWTEMKNEKDEDKEIMNQRLMRSKTEKGKSLSMFLSKKVQNRRKRETEEKERDLKEREELIKKKKEALISDEEAEKLKKRARLSKAKLLVKLEQDELMKSSQMGKLDKVFLGEEALEDSEIEVEKGKLYFVVSNRRG